jgi:metal-responsive CopG/Arc/MetJ family transcriptional regulator
MEWQYKPFLGGGEMRKAEKNIQISLRLPEEVLKRIDKEAERDGRTRNNMIVRLICLAADKHRENPPAKEGR